MHTNEDSLPGIEDLLRALDESPEEMAEFEANCVSQIANVKWSEPTTEINKTLMHKGHGSSAHITIRMPLNVLDAFKTEAARRGIGYQTLMIQALSNAMLSFGAALKTL